MDPTYGERHNLIALLPFDMAVLVANLVRGVSVGSELVQILIQLAILVPLHSLANRQVARLEGGKLTLLRGVGMQEPAEIAVSSVAGVERLNRRFLNIHHGGGTASVEATPAVLDALERDLRMPLLPESGR